MGEPSRRSKSVVTVLADVLGPGLKVVFCGTAVGEASARAGAYYAGPGNQFWSVLARVGLTPLQLAPANFRDLLEYGVGLTDLVKRRSGGDASLAAGDFDTEGFRARIEAHSPKVVAFNGKKAASVFYALPTSAISYGRQAEGIGETALFVLPSTSGSARGFWDESHWQALATFVKG
jgi:TDG/mug DNA glycosylase family protein